MDKARLVLGVVAIVLFCASWVMWGVAATNQIQQPKQDFMRPCDICPREYHNEGVKDDN